MCGGGFICNSLRRIVPGRSSVVGKGPSGNVSPERKGMERERFEQEEGTTDE